MRKFLLGSVGALVALGVSGAAHADVFVLANINKDKDKTIIENLTVTKDVFLDVVVVSFPDRFAESEAIVNQRNQDNVACENCAEKTDALVGSESGNSGITSVNMASGNMNNQGTAISVAFDSNGDGFEAFTEAQASIEQVNTFNRIDSENVLFRDALVDNSINGNTGLTYANLATGQMTNQANVISIAVSPGGGVALSESDLGQFNTVNFVAEEGEAFTTFKTAKVIGSINSNIGVTSVNVSSGNMGNQANVVSVAWSAPPPF